MKAATSRMVVGVGVVGGIAGIVYLLGRRHPRTSLPELPAEFKRHRGPEAPPEPVDAGPPRVATTRGSYR